MTTTVSKKPSVPAKSEHIAVPLLPSLPRFSFLDSAIAFSLGLMTVLAIAATAPEVGLTYDEPVYAGQSLRTQLWMKEVARRMAGGELLAVANPSLLKTYWESKDLQPSLLKIVTALLAPAASAILGDLAGYRIGTALFFGLLIAATCAFGTIAGNRRTGVAGALSLFFLPHVFAHAHLTSMDIPVASMTLLTTFLFFIAIVTERARWFLLAGISFGLALDTKMNAVLLLPSIITWVLWRGTSLRSNLLKIGMSALVGICVFIAIWPYMWYDTWSHLLKYARFHFQHHPVNVSYAGTIYPYAPWHYPLVMIAITTPLVTLALWLAGIGWIASTVRGVSVRTWGGVLWLFSALFQIAAFVIPTTPKYNGVRLFLAAFPFLCLMGGLALDRVISVLVLKASLANFLRGITNMQPKLGGILMFVALLPGIHGTMDSHPFGMSFYNAAIGGTPGAVRRGFEPTYWGDAFFQIVFYLNDHAKPNALVLVIPGSASWFIKFHRDSGYLREDIRITGDDKADYDWVIFHSRQSEMTPFAKTLLERARPAYAVRYNGVTLACAVTRDEAERAIRGE